MKYRFQETAVIDKSSYHPYPTRDLLYAYKHQEKVQAMLERIEAGEVSDCDAGSVDDVENYILDGYVCCHHTNMDDEDLQETMQFEGSGCAASHNYVIVFWEEEDDQIFDGWIAEVGEVVAVYKKIENTTDYIRIE